MGAWVQSLESTMREEGGKGEGDREGKRGGEGEEMVKQTGGSLEMTVQPA